MAVGAVLALALSAALSEARQLTPEEIRQQLEEARKKARALEARKKDVELDLSKLKISNAELNRKLIDTARRIQDAEKQLTITETRLGELEAQEDLIRGSLARRHGKIAQLLAAMQRMGRQPPPVLVTRRDDALKVVRSAMLLASVFPELKTQADRLSQALSELVRVTEEIREKSKLLRTTKAQLEADQQRITKLIAAKKAKYAARWKELEALRRDTRDYARKVASLGELIKKASRRVAAKSSLGRYERELAAGLGGEGVTVLKPSTKRVAMLSPGRMKPGLPFIKTRGRLPMPVSGRRIANFGDRDEFGARLQGIRLATRPAARVTSPCDGWVVYAGPFRSYGQLLIIDAGGGYHVLLAGMGRLDVAEGQFVLAGEPVAVMAGEGTRREVGAVQRAGGDMQAARLGEAASGQRGQDGAIGQRLRGGRGVGQAGVAVLRAAARAPLEGEPEGARVAVGTAEKSPILYIEFRKNGRPIDPDPWWSKGTRGLQG